MFQLSVDEKAEVIANCDHLDKLKFSKSLPYAFTEHGAIMAASVLNSPKAVEAIKQLMDPKPPPKTRRIGFNTN